MTEKRSAPSRRRGLGRGLSALMDDYPASAADGSLAGGSANLPIDLLRPNPYQPRRSFDAAELDELVASIRGQGVLQPILVRPAGEETAGGERAYEIIAGERRWRAAQKAGLHEIPAVVREVDDTAALEVALIENVQRRDLSPIEEALGYRRLIDEFGHRQEDIASAVGKSRSHIANLLRLLGLPEEVQSMLADGRLSMGHARALIGAGDPKALADRIVRDGLTVRRAEALAGETKPASGRGRAARPVKDADTRALESDLSQALGLHVEITYDKGDGGRVTIHYKTLEQLDDLCQRLILHGHGDSQ